METIKRNFPELAAGVKLLEARVRDLELETVKQKYEITTLEKNYNKLDKEFNDYRDKVNSGWSKLIWILAGGFLSGLVTWIIRGGMNNVGI